MNRQRNPQKTLSPFQMPEPWDLVQHDDGSVCAVMFHYLDSEATLATCRKIAKEHGLELDFVDLDTQPNAEDFQTPDGDWIDDVMSKWRPYREGWMVVMTNWADDGPYVTFARDLTAADALPDKEGA